MPAHITLVTPFAPPPVPAELISELERIVGLFPIVDLRFEAVGRFPHTLYLKPEPADAIVELTHSIVSRWPEWLPYGGIHAEVIPHVTVADRIEDRRLLDALARTVEDRLPIETRVGAAWLVQESEEGIWQRLVELPFQRAGAAA
jgi:2'-5' RNA ligase